MNNILWSLAVSCLLAPPVKTSDEATTHLYVRTSPAGAEIVLDGKSIGKSPGVFPVESGARRLVIELDGHVAEDQTITFRNGRVTRIELTLKPRPEASADPSHPFQRRKVGKKISDFPEAVDLSTPESAWAAYTRASGGQDARGVVDISWVKIDPRDMEQFWTKDDPEDMAVYLKAQLDAELLEVLVYRGKLATTISKLEFPPGVGRNPYSSRTFGLIDGKWKNLGEDRCGSVGAATGNFAGNRDALWQHYQEIAEELTNNEPATVPSADQSETRRRHFVRLVVDAKSLTFQGQETTWDELRKLLKKTSSRPATVLEIARTSVDLTANQWDRAQANAARLAQELGFEYLSYIGVHPLGSKGSPSQTVPRKQPRPTTDEPISFSTVVNVLASFAPNPKNQPEKLLDLDTGKWVKIEKFGDDVRDTHIRIREEKIDLLGGVEGGGPGVLLFDVAVMDIPSARWDAITPAEVVDDWRLKQNEPQPITALAPINGAKLPMTCLFETREGTLGVLQLVGVSSDVARTAKIRYKLVQRTKADCVTGWTCSMHPQVVARKPGKCPLCAMDLIIRAKGP